MRLHTPWLPILFFSLAACGEGAEEIPKAPQLISDRDEMAFDQEFRSGTYVGTTGFNSVQVKNMGEDTLDVSSIALSGPNVFTMKVSKDGQDLNPQEAFQVKSKERFFVEVAFRPREAQQYQGALVIKSNAANLPEKSITLNGLGIAPP
ncbi:hypothetical protein OWM54_13395 [Myxococcus sp. MISCRS1]|jgi:hypothetical protein|uniref:hypothetical protein n=1 Tax=Myxococcus TaxID=32 RepID=UPI001CBD4E15|nr:MULTISPECIES: hypothetical protein [unclassified Myxococcus]MBZ4400255.1 hypothetical protein [Myxococcus sp. AS-1-15]MBZ4407955.1 hypothetical protein [Myxococcus sp. XM-1-1-1]MCY0998123.1 hypothetical protein [Myxococcus sp. MISCRS1]BDT31807.1 lipoprotein [Myxococcus sp. MH1]